MADGHDIDIHHLNEAEHLLHQTALHSVVCECLLVFFATGLLEFLQNALVHGTVGQLAQTVNDENVIGAKLGKVNFRVLGFCILCTQWTVDFAM